MRSLETPLRKGKRLRVAGFDDAPFDKFSGEPVSVAGIICSGTRFEGMLWGKMDHDGFDATQRIVEMVASSKFHDQLNLVLCDGITMAGFNVVDLPSMAEQLQIPCLAVMRRPPNPEKFLWAMENIPDSEKRRALVDRAGPIHSLNGFHFQVAGCTPDTGAHALKRLTDVGDVPEALRLAHLIAAAVKTGQSSKRA